MAKAKKAGPRPSVPASKQPQPKKPSTASKTCPRNTGDTKKSDVLMGSSMLPVMKQKPKTAKQTTIPKNSVGRVVVSANPPPHKTSKLETVSQVVGNQLEEASPNKRALKSRHSLPGPSTKTLKKMLACANNIETEPASSTEACGDRSSPSVNLSSKSCELILSPTLPIDKDVETQFYGTKVLLYTLGQIQDVHTKRPRYYGDSDHEASELRRSFVNHLAYICDYQKGGETVTAIALQATFQGIRFWIATNQGVKQKVRDFLGTILQEVVHIPA